MSERLFVLGLTVTAVALAAPGPARAAEAGARVPLDLRTLPVPAAKREAALRKQPKSVRRDAKRRLLPRAAPLPGQRPKELRKSKTEKRWPSARTSRPGRRGADGAGGGLADTPCGQCPVKDIGCGTPGSGVLSAGDCQLGDGSFLDVWKLEIPAPREVTVELTSTAFDTYLGVLNDQCELLFENDDCGVDNFDLSCIASPLAAGTYYILANSFSAGESGEYSLDVRCEDITACVDCLTDHISCNETLSGELFDGDCVEPDGAHYDIYSFDITESSRIQATMRSEFFDTFLSLLDKDCLPIAENDDCAPQDFSRSCLVLDLEPGSYHLRLGSFEGGSIGPYDVTLECFPGFDRCDDCVVGPVVCGETSTGAFPAGRCVELDGKSLDLYPFELAEAGPVTVTLTSTGFDTFLRLFDADCEEVAVNDDCDPQNFDVSCLEDVELEAGRYFVGVSSFAAGETGDFSLEVRCPDFGVCRDCVTGRVSCGESASGVLGAGTCKLGDGRAHDLWRLDVFGQDAIDLALAVSAEGFEPAVALLSGACEVICEGDGPDACRELRQLSPGTYYVRVAGSAAEAAGSYTLQVGCSLWDPCASCLAEPLLCGTEAAGSLADGDCVFDDGTFLDAWPFALDQPQTVAVNLTSPDFDTFLFLLDSDCVPIVTSDDCDANTTDSCFTVDLDAGDYLVVANSFARATGDYSLSVGCSDIMTCVDCRVGPLTCGQPVTGSLPTSGCQLTDRSSVDYYEIVLPADGVLDLQLTSEQFDTFLFLYDESCLPIAFNDDCSPDNFGLSCLSLDLPRGTYYAVVNSFSAGEAGDYELTATCSGGGAPEGLRLPGDCNEDSSLSVSDVQCLLSALFTGIPSPVICGGVPYFELPLSDFDGNGSASLTDAVAMFSHLFDGGPPHVLGTECVPIEGCESECEL